MKRAALVAVIALTFLFAMSAVAFADVAINTGNFEAWTTAPGVDTPHVGYSTTSVKCAVCHSVHNADASDETTQNILLRTTKEDACTYCHIGGSIVDSSKQPYGSNAANYTTDDNSNHSSDPGDLVIVSYGGCTSCHSVHGANTYTDDDVASAILRTGTVDADAVTAGYDVSGDKAEILTAFCSQCHPYYTEEYDVDDDDEGNHIMVDTVANPYANPDASTLTSGVAAVADATCQSCHDATTDSTNNFPHYMPDNRRFLFASDYYGTGSVVEGDVSDPSADGACIKCHSWGSGGTATGGVGIDF